MAIIPGTPNDDINLDGTGEADQINLLAGHDSSNGLDGNDTLNGGEGDDTLNGGNDNDSLNGGNGTDSLLGGAGNDTVNGSDGLDSFDGGAGSDVLSISVTDNATVFDFTNFNINAGVNNTLRAGVVVKNVEFLSINAGIGNDRMSLGLNGGQLSGNGGNDTLYGSNSTTTDDILLGGDGQDVLFGRDGNDAFLQGGIGNDTINGGTGNDVLSGNDDNDLLNGDEDNDLLHGANGNDTLDGGGGNDTLNGSFGADLLIGRGGDDSASASDGLDSFNGGSGTDTLSISVTDNAVVFDFSAFSIKEGTVNTLRTGVTVVNVEHLSINAGSGDDRMSLGNNGGQLTGNGGNDTLYGGNGAAGDSLIGGAGHDLIYGRDGDDVTLQGGEGNDTINGGGGADSLSGHADNDRLNGDDGADVLVGSDGDDTLVGGDGADTMHGGFGNDTFYTDGTDTITDGGPSAGIDRVYSAADFSLAALPDFEHVNLKGPAAFNATGNGSANELTGNSNPNVLSGGDGADTLIGGFGKDTLSPGNDTHVDHIRADSPNHSSDTLRDLVKNFDANEDKFDLVVSVVDVQTVSGSLSEGSFNQNLASILDGILVAGSAVVLDPNGGNLNQAGMVYLIVDGNGVAGYQPGGDYVFQLQNHTGTIDPGDFV